MADISRLLLDQVNSARHEGSQLNIVGGGSKAFMGRDVSGSSINVGDHSGIVSYQPVELVLTARAGTPLSDIEAVLDEQDQMLAFEPPNYNNRSTLGGTLACHLSGPARPWCGSVRDHVLGIRLINGKGEHLRFGGQVMKNVAGYDVSRLQAGAMGTLGLITEVSLKVLPKPAYSLTLVEEMGPDKAIRVMNERAGEPKPLSAACWLAGRLYLRLSGARSAVEATAQQWSGEPLDEAAAFWRELRDQQLDFFAGDEPLWRFSVNPTATQPDIGGDWLLDWGGAQRWLRAKGELEAMELLAAEAGGQVSLFRGGDRCAEVFHRPPQALVGLQQRIKTAFDPDVVFNPGRLYSWM
ncbi:MAG: glycolate oxidase subunit GlcE [Motiliproteus sp.]